MTDRQEAKLNMYQGVAKVCHEHEYAGMAAMINGMLLLDGCIAGILQADKPVAMFKTPAPNFYALHKNARNIIDTAKRSRKPVENK